MTTKNEQPEKLTAAEVEERLSQIKLRTAEIQLKKAEMELEQTEEQIQQFEAEREGKRRRNQQRQSQMRKEVDDAARKARKCSHRQGGSVGKNNPEFGKGPSALTIAVMPDSNGKTELIMCSICRLRVWSPNPMNQSPKPRNGETAQEAKQRAIQYERDFKEFEELRELAMDKLTPEAARPMDCGVTFSFQDGDGRDVLVPRPCDSYLQGLDNRQGAA